MLQAGLASQISTEKHLLSKERTIAMLHYQLRALLHLPSRALANELDAKEHTRTHLLSVLSSLKQHYSSFEKRMSVYDSHAKDDKDRTLLTCLQQLLSQPKSQSQ